MEDRSHHGLARREFLTGAAATMAALSLPVSVSGAFAQVPSDTRLHGLSAFGDLKYPEGFTAFGYVNVDAPKGGRFHFQPPTRMFNQNFETFNTLNSFVLRGDAPPRMDMCFDTLMVSALDEPDSLYCHLAAWVEVSPDRNSYRFGLRPEARFHDGTPVTAHDVAFSYDVLRREGHPAFGATLINLERAEALDDATFELAFNGEQSARAILSSAGLPVLSRAHYAERTFDAATLAVPLSSGPYRVGRLESGRFIEYERVADYWAADLATARGLNNFDVIRIDFLASRIAAFELFKRGDLHWRQEVTSSIWATEYNFPALTQGHVIKAEFPREMNPSMQFWALNQRRAKFSDRATREAIGLTFPFEWTNRNIMYGLFARMESLFERSELKAEGMPSADELALMDSLQAPLPEGVREEAARPPVSDGSQRDRALMQQANRLLTEAGWQRQANGLTRNGETLTVEILFTDPVFESRHAGMVANMRALGIDATMRLLDPAQYAARVNDFDFDMVMAARSISPTPTAESLENMFSSREADRPGTSNLPGAKDPVIDELIGRVGKAQSRAELVTVMRVLDRVLRARLDWIPNWFAPNHWVAYWDMFGFVEPKPDYGWPVEALWWFDEEKAKAIGKA
jgi:microcin C transport system substrate-binding protein